MKKLFLLLVALPAIGLCASAQTRTVKGTVVDAATAEPLIGASVTAAGSTMGGHGAMWLGIRHHDIWGSAASMSGGVDIRPFKNRWKMASLIDPDGTNQQAWETHTAINLIPTLAKGDLNILVDCGVDDFFIEVNRDFHRALLEAGIDHDYIERPGAHTQAYWRNSVLYHLLFFHEVFNK